ncbi:Cycloeucalenol cycloisomerase isoform B [Chlorella sorokiniana]|uniref:Cycloeucalenol cycloisomerase isoform B n=1 Tax=Chlorella sorokiniana TaxID=3076 RepID=A0A2P6TF33_CHLSO|nr:Cycloeucalenol cycloisomerase isoform B [Chlorella sorokiniana]|eukprot:PRW32580.1 Cycloeucalenol cycloisomerase isoform B [Chlorella sorokiniana]
MGSEYRWEDARQAAADILMAVGWSEDEAWALLAADSRVRSWQAPAAVHPSSGEQSPAAMQHLSSSEQAPASQLQSGLTGLAAARAMGALDEDDAPAAASDLQAAPDLLQQVYASVIGAGRPWPGPRQAGVELLVVVGYTEEQAQALLPPGNDAQQPSGQAAPGTSHVPGLLPWAWLGRKVGGSLRRRLLLASPHIDTSTQTAAASGAGTGRHLAGWADTGCNSKGDSSSREVNVDELNASINLGVRATSQGSSQAQAFGSASSGNVKRVAAMVDSDARANGLTGGALDLLNRVQSVQPRSPVLPSLASPSPPLSPLPPPEEKCECSAGSASNSCPDGKRCIQAAGNSEGCGVCFRCPLLDRAGGRRLSDQADLPCDCSVAGLTREAECAAQSKQWTPDAVVNICGLCACPDGKKTKAECPDSKQWTADGTFTACGICACPEGQLDDGNGGCQAQQKAVSCPDGTKPSSEEQSACEGGGKLWIPDESVPDCGRCACPGDSLLSSEAESACTSAGKVWNTDRQAGDCGRCACPGDSLLSSEAESACTSAGKVWNTDRQAGDCGRCACPGDSLLSSEAESACTSAGKSWIVDLQAGDCGRCGCPTPRVEAPQCDSEGLQFLASIDLAACGTCGCTGDLVVQPACAGRIWTADKTATACGSCTCPGGTQQGTDAAKSSCAALGKEWLASTEAPGCGSCECASGSDSLSACAAPRVFTKKSDAVFACGKCDCPTGSQLNSVGQASCQAAGRQWTTVQGASECGSCGCPGPLMVKSSCPTTKLWTPDNQLTGCGKCECPTGKVEQSSCANQWIQDATYTSCGTCCPAGQVAQSACTGKQWTPNSSPGLASCGTCNCPTDTQETSSAKAACESGGRAWTVSPTASACGSCGCPSPLVERSACSNPTGWLADATRTSCGTCCPAGQVAQSACSGKTWTPNTSPGLASCGTCNCPTDTQETSSAKAACESGGRAWTVSPTASACGSCGCPSPLVERSACSNTFGWVADATRTSCGTCCSSGRVSEAACQGNDWTASSRGSVCGTCSCTSGRNNCPVNPGRCSSGQRCEPSPAGTVCGRPAARCSQLPLLYQTHQSPARGMAATPKTPRAPRGGGGSGGGAGRSKLSPWLAPSPGKRWTELFFLAYSPSWIIWCLCILVPFKIYDRLGKWGYLSLGLMAAPPCFILPFFLQPKAEAEKPLTQRYWVKANAWIAVFTFIGNYFWTHYFYRLLGASYTFPAHNLNQVPITLYFMTHAYFCLYHALSNLLIRRARAAVARYGSTAQAAVEAVVVFVLAYATAYGETLTIAHFPYYSFKDRSRMYSVGSLFYAIYFFVSFPMFFRMDENPKAKPFTLWRAVVDALAAGMLVTCLLDFWRIAMLLFTSACVLVAAAPQRRTMAGANVRQGVSRWEPGEAEFAPDRVMVQFKATPTAAAAAATQAAQPLPGLQLVRLVGEHHRIPVQSPPGPGVAAAAVAGRSRLPPSAHMLFRITDNTTVPQKVAQLRANPAVAIAEPVYIYRVARAPNDPSFAEAYLTSGMWHLRKVFADVAWDRQTGSKNIGVCVVDTGSTKLHKDLAGNIAGGWNRAYNPTTRALPAFGTPEYYAWDDTSGHGTHTSGTIGAVGNNGLGVSGVAWNIALYICRAETPNEGLYFDAIYDCYSLCASTPGVKIVSASFGGASDAAIGRSYIDLLRSKGILFVAAAGNEGQNANSVPYYPASYSTSYDNVISVAASLPDDTLTSFSNYGSPIVQIAAPGSNIWSTSMSGGYETMSGTSMATPMVSGAAALLWSAKPTATYQEIKAALFNFADQVVSTNQVEKGRRLNVARALNGLLGLSAPAVPKYTTALKEDANVMYYLSIQFATYSLSWKSQSECKAGCLASPWCYYFVASDAQSYLDVGSGYGSCLWCDASCIVTSHVYSYGYLSGQKRSTLVQPPRIAQISTPRKQQRRPVRQPKLLRRFR